MNTLHKKTRHPLTTELEARRFFSSSPAGIYSFSAAAPATLVDSDGTSAIFALTGPGIAQVAVDPAGAWHLIAETTTAKSALSISCTGGDGQITLAEVSAAPGHSLKSLAAPTVNLDGPFSLPASTVTLANVGVAGEATAPALTLISPIGPKAPVSFSAKQVTAATLTSASPIKLLQVAAWAPSTTGNGSISAPSLDTLSSASDFSANLSLTLPKAILKSATVAGTESGDWSIAGNVGTLTLGQLRGQISIAGNAKTTTVGDHVALITVPSSTGGSIQIGGTGKFSAPGDAFSVANTTLYTCGAEMYSYAEIKRLDRAGETVVRKTDGKRITSRVLPQVGLQGGMKTYTEADSDGTAETIGIDASGSVYELNVSGKPGDPILSFANLQIAPDRFTLGITYSYSGTFNTALTPFDSSFFIEGVATQTMRFTGHQLIKTPAGNFVAAKIFVDFSLKGSGSLTANNRTLSMNLYGDGLEFDTPFAGDVSENGVLGYLLSETTTYPSSIVHTSKTKSNTSSILVTLPTSL